MTYTLTEKMNILKYARQYGPIAASRHFNVPSCSIIRWNRKYKVYETQKMRTFSVAEKTEILQFAETNGLTAAMHKYNIDMSTMRVWNETLKIYNQCGRKTNASYKTKYCRETDEYKINVLNFARQFGPSAAFKKFRISSATLSEWNKKFKIYKTRIKRVFTPNKKREIIQFADEHGPEAASRQFCVRCNQIQQWRDDINHKKY